MKYMFFNKRLKRADGDIAFKKLAKEYRKRGQNLEKMKNYALNLQRKNRELMIENESLKVQIKT